MVFSRKMTAAHAVLPVVVSTLVLPSVVVSRNSRHRSFQARTCPIGARFFNDSTNEPPSMQHSATEESRKLRDRHPPFSKSCYPLATHQMLRPRALESLKSETRRMSREKMAAKAKPKFFMFMPNGIFRAFQLFVDNRAELMIPCIVHLIH